MEKHHHKTAQRAAILEYLKDNKSHPSIIDIYEHVLEKLSTISMTTVYNTIDILKKEGVIQELALRNHAVRRFDSNPTPHDHLICSICGNIVDIELNIGQSLILTEKQQHGFDIKERSITIYGVCPKCKNIDSKSDIH
jgi:Fur family transcriptional regulator, peroxide stress response regulator